jgi:hypothetical protein
MHLMSLFCCMHLMPLFCCMHLMPLCLRDVSCETCPMCCQVSVAEERHRNLKEALEVDIASIGGQADKIKVCIALKA